ncbi:sugar ABC transporter substrate-binding protein [Spirochaetia bacterium]|nr:sugar ABC transporter substrate-binding protein [Spirochaetia bacterium]GHU37139.1 sugar ABC transporter substrate-binding protein [Spirochaetia bacterium]
MNVVRKMLFTGLVMAVMTGTAFASGQQGSQDTGKGLIGVVMPTRSEERWIKDGNAVKEGLEKLGYKVNLQFSDDDIPTQTRQIDDMITGGVKALVIASIDGSALSNQLANAAAAKIPIIAYDRLLMQSPNVDYYVSFDNYKVGGQMGDILIRGLKLDQATTAKPVIIELFAGSPDDNNSVGFYQGAMDKLQPYFTKGVLRVPSGQIERTVIGTLRWDASEAQKRMENLLSAYYSGNVVLDGILSPYDPISLSTLEACKAVGYGTTPGKPLPIVGGQDCVIASCKSILAGEQYATVLKDTRSLGAATVTLVDTLMQGRTPNGLDTQSYNNGAKIVPSLLLDSVIVTKDNLISAVVDTGYHTAAELGL